MRFGGALSLQDELHRLVDELNADVKQQLHAVVGDLNEEQVREALTRTIVQLVATLDASSRSWTNSTVKCLSAGRDRP